MSHITDLLNSEITSERLQGVHLLAQSDDTDRLKRLQHIADNDPDAEIRTQARLQADKLEFLYETKLSAQEQLNGALNALKNGDDASAWRHARNALLNEPSLKDNPKVLKFITKLTRTNPQQAVATLLSHETSPYIPSDDTEITTQSIAIDIALRSLLVASLQLVIVTIAYHAIYPQFFEIVRLTEPHLTDQIATALHPTAWVVIIGYLIYFFMTWLLSALAMITLPVIAHTIAKILLRAEGQLKALMLKLTIPIVTLATVTGVVLALFAYLISLIILNTVRTLDILEPANDFTLGYLLTYYAPAPIVLILLPLAHIFL